MYWTPRHKTYIYREERGLVRNNELDVNVKRNCSTDHMLHFESVYVSSCCIDEDIGVTSYARMVFHVVHVAVLLGISHGWIKMLTNTQHAHTAM